MLKALDLFCCAGGASVGLYRAGFDVTGVDLKPSRNYPFKIIKADVLHLDPAFLRGFDFVWASPMCQAHSVGAKFKGVAHKYIDQIPQTRDLLRASGVDYVIENVPTAPLIDPFMLCGSMFGLQIRRHRLFESNVKIRVPINCKHTYNVITVAGHGTWRRDEGMRAMGITHRMTKWEIAQAVPPMYAYTIGRFFYKRLLHAKQAENQL